MTGSSRDVYWWDYKITGLGEHTTSEQIEGMTDPAFILCFHILNVEFPEDPPVGTQVFQYCDSWSLPNHHEPTRHTNFRREGLRRDALGRLYDWYESPYIKTINEIWRGYEDVDSSV